MAESMGQSRRRKQRKTRVGVVVSGHKTPKTICVQVHDLVPHSKYGKYVRCSAKLHVHDEKAEAKRGDRVEVMECRPISRTKAWRLVKVLTAAPQD